MSDTVVTYKALLKDNVSSGLSRMSRTGQGAFNKMDSSQKKFESSSKRTGTSISGLENKLNKLKSTRKISVDSKEIKSLNREIDKTEKKLKKMQTMGMSKSFLGGGMIKNALPILAGGGLLAGGISLGKEILETRAKYQKFEAVLTTALGSESEAKGVMSQIQTFAKQTPFQVDEITGAYVKLVNQGFKPTMAEMTSMGDLAASTGKDFDMLAEAVIDAQVGEFERLKEFGIKARTEGNKVKFTFKGVTTEVNNNADAIRAYLVGLGNTEGVSGSMEAISKTLGGQISNLGDAWDSLLNNMGKNTESVFGKAIKFITEAVAGLAAYFETTEDKLLRQNKMIEEGRFKGTQEAFDFMVKTKMENDGKSKEQAVKEQLEFQRQVVESDIAEFQSKIDSITAKGKSYGTVISNKWENVRKVQDIKKLRKERDKFQSMIDERKREMERLDAIYNPAAAPGMAGAGLKDAGLSDIEGDKRVIRNITINIGKQIESLIFNTASLDENLNLIESKIRQVLAITLNDANIIAAQ